LVRLAAEVRRGLKLLFDLFLHFLQEFASLLK